MIDEKAQLAPGGPTTQTSVAVRVLIAYINRLLGLPVPESAEDLPEFYRLDSGLCLVRDGKGKDVYYVTTPADCSCLARCLNPAEPCDATSKFGDIAFDARDISVFGMGFTDKAGISR